MKACDSFPPEEIADLLSDEHAEDFFIGGAVDRDDKALVLYRGNFEPLLVPLDWFEARPRRPQPDFDALALTDLGNTVQLGDYEAGADAISTSSTRRRVAACASACATVFRRRASR